MKTKYSFEVHAYAPELNKVFIGSSDVTSKFPDQIVKSFTKDYRSNIRKIRAYYGRTYYNHFISIKYTGENSGFIKELRGGFDIWDQALPVIRKSRDWFKTEVPKREISFTWKGL